jgi:transcription initiation factor TFIIIB Brf1 subunit/transcription initiation factor TFIIB
MDAFLLFDKANRVYENKNAVSCDNITTACSHTQSVVVKSIEQCVECGEHIRTVINHEKEWRFYGHNDGKHNTDPSRVQSRKVNERSIKKDIVHMGFSDKIVETANDLYTQVTTGQIYRGESRKAIIFACIFHAYKLDGNCQTPGTLMKVFGLTKKNSLRGLKIVNVHAPKDSPIHTTSLTPIHHIDDIMDKFSATKEQKADVVTLFSMVKNRSSKLNRARPQSIAASLIYYWIVTSNMKIDIKHFADKTELSELTINKNVKEITRIIALQKKT